MLKATLLCYTGFLHTPVAISKAQLLCYIRFQAHSSTVAMLKQHYYATRVFYTLLWLYSIMLHAFSTHSSGYIKSNITMLHVFYIHSYGYILLCYMRFLHTSVATLKATLLCYTCFQAHSSGYILLCYTRFLHTSVAILKATLLCYTCFQAHSSGYILLCCTRFLHTSGTILKATLVCYTRFQAHSRDYVKSSIMCNEFCPKLHYVQWVLPDSNDLATSWWNRKISKLEHFQYVYVMVIEKRDVYKTDAFLI